MAEIRLRKRSDIPSEYKWKLEDIYAEESLLEEEMQQALALAEKMSKSKGKLGSSAQILLSFLEDSDRLGLLLQRIIVYTSQHSHEDTAVAKNQAAFRRAQDLSVKANSLTAYADPEILAIPEETLEQFYKELPALGKYRRAIDRILRSKEHVLSDAEEAILAAAGQLATAPSDIYSMLNNADIKFPSITDVLGNRQQITHGNFLVFQRDSDRSVRRETFKSLYHTYAKLGNTISAAFTAHLKQEQFFASLRHYDSVRQMHLFENNIPETVYDNLIASMHAHLPAMHRYVALRKKMLGVERLHMYDLYVPIVNSMQKEYSFEEAKETVAAGLAPLGEEYVSFLKSGMDGGWIDVYENENKRTGAYSWGTYDVHPYVLLNYQGKLGDVFTLAHEMGHSMHTFYANRNNDFTYAGYCIFVAEVASTCNECLLMHHLLEQTSDEQERKALINHQLESFRTTVFRQTLFAEFEMIVHKRLQDSESLTMEDLNKIYRDLNILYYGPDIVVDEEIGYEWMRIPHFYSTFYVYQYATGYSAAVAFSRKILEEGPEAALNYIRTFLSGGGSKDPIDLLREAGVDLGTPKPVDDALAVFEDYLAQMEELCGTK